MDVLQVQRANPSWLALVQLCTTEKMWTHSPASRASIELKWFVVNMSGEGSRYWSFISDALSVEWCRAWICLHHMALTNALVSSLATWWSVPTFYGRKYYKWSNQNSFLFTGFWLQLWKHFVMKMFRSKSHKEINPGPNEAVVLLKYTRQFKKVTHKARCV